MKDLFLLHGALGAKSQFSELEEKLADSFRIHLLNFSGHGGEVVSDEPFSIKLFAGDVIDYLNTHGIESIDIFGYSMGGYVGIYAARHFHHRIGKVFTIGTKFKWDEESSAREVKMLNPVKMKEKIPQYYEELAKRHSPDRIEDILQRTAGMMTKLGKKNELQPEDFGAIRNEVTVGVGDRDKSVTVEETVDVFRRLSNGRLLVLPNTPHPFEQINLSRLVWEMRNFF